VKTQKINTPVYHKTRLKSMITTTNATQLHTITTMNESRLRQLINKCASSDMDDDTCDYLASVLIDQESDFEDTITDFIEGEAAHEKALELETLSLEQESPILTNKVSTSLSAPLSPEKGVSTDKGANSEGLHPPRTSKSIERRQNKREAKNLARVEKKKEKNRSAVDEFVDDDISMWNARLADGKAWGGQSYGGRGVRGDVNTASNIHLANVTMQFAGNELLQNSTIQINGGHRYGLVGRNGCGKSTLLRRLDAHALPGIPHDLRILLVKQQIEGGNETALEALMSADRERMALVEELST
jgi:ABC-type multidrug transport system fused ATPase/permease subunit